MNNSFDELMSRLDTAKSKSEGTLIKIIQNEDKQVKTQRRLSNQKPWDTIRGSNIDVTGVTGGRERQESKRNI